MAKVQPPDAINHAFAVACNARLIERILALYEPGVVAVNRHGAEHQGHDAIARDLALPSAD